MEQTWSRSRRWRNRGKPRIVSNNLAENICNTYSGRNSNILDEENTLRLNDEEVDKLVDVRGEGIECRLGNGIILLWAKLRSKPGGQDWLSSNLSQHSHSQCHICNLECVSEDIEISGSEDKRDNGGEGNAGGSGIVPWQQAREEGVVMCELLTGGSWSCWCCAGGSEIREFGLSLCMLVFDAVRNGA